MITRVPDRDFGSVAMSNVVPRFTVDPAQLSHAAGDVGQDNSEVYRDWLGLSAEEVEATRSQQGHLTSGKQPASAPTQRKCS
ncbi:MAG TPA: hypothetical protein VMU69_21915 [Bradyrhizobium sp.]|nr:hypothetical protein [Bradyrhizobium sp.]